MGKGGGSIIVGYKYFLGAHLAICHGPVDVVRGIQCDSLEAWPLATNTPATTNDNQQTAGNNVYQYGDPQGLPAEDAAYLPPPGAPAVSPATAPEGLITNAGNLTTSGQIYIDSPELFGGKAKEGGVQGLVDVIFGEPDEQPNSYLQSILGPIVPAFKGVLSLVLRQCYVASYNPNIKPWSVDASRVHRSHGGDLQWYDAKAAIPSEYGNEAVVIPEAQIVGKNDVWRFGIAAITNNTGVPSGDYSAVDLDDSAWPTGDGPFGDRAHASALVNSYWGAPGTILYANTGVWLRRTVGVSQPADIYLRLARDNFVHVYWNGVEVTSGFSAVPGGDASWETQVTIPASQVRTQNTLAIYFADQTVVGSGNYFFGGCEVTRRAVTVMPGAYDMNPAHIVRECLTSYEWGKGIAESEIDDASFTAAANALYDELFGLSLTWEDTGNVDDFIDFVMEHVDGSVYQDRTTGKWKIKLVRDDYDVADLITLGPDNIRELEDFNRPAPSELINRVTVTYWDREHRKNLPITIDNEALQQANGGNVNAKTVDRTGICGPILAMKVCQRELRTLSTPLASGTITVNRAGVELGPGDPFIFDWPELGISGLVMRVANIDYGNLTDGTITIKVIEDVFALPATPLVVPPVSQWSSPSTAPEAPDYRYVGELPYWTVIKEIVGESASDYAALDPDSNALAVSSVRMSSNTLGASVWTSQGAASMTRAGQTPMCATMTIPVAAGRMDVFFTYENLRDSSRIVSGKYAAWDDELVMVYALDSTNGTIILTRGVLDTVPQEHAAGSRLFFLEGYQFVGETEYATSEVVNVEQTPRTSQGELLLADGVVDTYTFAHRHIRPYPPGNVMINGDYFPPAFMGDLAITWAHRNRIQQTVYLVGFTEGSIGPEAGVSYTLRIEGDGGVLMREVTGLTGTSYTYLATDEMSDNGGALNNTLTLTLKAVRAGYDSWQSHAITVDRADYGYSYGEYYGGIA